MLARPIFNPFDIRIANVVFVIVTKLRYREATVTNPYDIHNEVEPI
jgi:hypothetical protein